MQMLRLAIPYPPAIMVMFKAQAWRTQMSEDRFRPSTPRDAGQRTTIIIETREDAGGYRCFCGACMRPMFDGTPPQDGRNFFVCEACGTVNDSPSDR